MLQYCIVLDISCSQEQMTHYSNHKSPSLPYGHCNMAFALRAAFPRFPVQLHVLWVRPVILMLQFCFLSITLWYLITHRIIYKLLQAHLHFSELLLQKSSNIKYIFSSGSRPLIISIFRCCIIPKILAINYKILRPFYANDILAY